jgi:DNA-binding transcriptional LysR family regulator
MDWNDLRFFLAVARSGTLSAAAKRLNVTQSTVGRRLASLEGNMGVRLLQRVADGYEPTLAGEMIRPYVERIEADALSLELEVSGTDTRLEGVVRVTSLHMVASHLLAPCFAKLQHLHPSIMIEMIPNLPPTALSAHDVDISVRLTPFEQHELVVRSMGHMSFGLYGSVSYLDRYGQPDTVAGCVGHRLITALDPHLPAQAAWLAEHAGDAKTVMKSDSYEVQHSGVMCGGAIALLPRFRADAELILRRIDTHVPIPGAEISLAVHRENRHTPRVRTVLDCIFETVRGRAGTLNPAEP